MSIRSNAAKFASLVVASVAYLTPGVPCAEPLKLQVVPEVRTGFLILGGHRPTGGMVVGVEGRAYHGDSWGWLASLTADAIDPPGGWHWMGLTLAPGVGTWRRDGKFTLSALVDVPLGQLPTCNDWGICLRYWGAYPRVQVRGQYPIAEGATLGLEGGVTIVRTLGWAGAGWVLVATGSWQ